MDCQFNINKCINDWEKKQLIQIRCSFIIQNVNNKYGYANFIIVGQKTANILNQIPNVNI